MPEPSDGRAKSEDLSRRIYATGLFLLITLGSVAAQETAGRSLPVQNKHGNGRSKSGSQYDSIP